MMMMKVVCSNDAHYTGKEDIDLAKFLTTAANDHGLRGHQFRLYKHPCRLNTRRNFFSQRIIDVRGMDFRPTSWRRPLSTPLNIDWMTSCNKWTPKKPRLTRSITNM